MKTNFHTHSTWCDGRDTTAAMARVAAAKGFDAIGFSSHATYPADQFCTVPAKNMNRYFAEVRDLAAKYAGREPRLAIFCGVEADYIPGFTDPDRSRYAKFAPDYVIGSVHYVVAPDRGIVPVDHTPQLLAEGIDEHFDGDAAAYVRAYFAQVREMAQKFDFDILGHLDLCRKFNARHPYFDRNAKWYREELVLTADAVAASGKLVEVNTGAISRGWLDDAYPSNDFRDLLRERGVRFILSSDAHFADALDCAFDRFGAAEDYVLPPWCRDPAPPHSALCTKL